mmetsp:Transcript_4915/g.13816  ORF Transcript_4915/g.13816 Transcript_4915/m.13816 type:complete len:480 (+) Transcript_4915:1749-3188(+)
MHYVVPSEAPFPVKHAQLDVRSEKRYDVHFKPAPAAGRVGRTLFIRIIGRRIAGMSSLLDGREDGWWLGGTEPALRIVTMLPAGTGSGAPGATGFPLPRTALIGRRVAIEAGRFPRPRGRHQVVHEMLHAVIVPQDHQAGALVGEVADVVPLCVPGERVALLVGPFLLQSPHRVALESEKVQLREAVHKERKPLEQVPREVQVHQGVAQEAKGAGKGHEPVTSHGEAAEMLERPNGLRELRKVVAAQIQGLQLGELADFLRQDADAVESEVQLDDTPHVGRVEQWGGNPLEVAVVDHHGEDLDGNGGAALVLFGRLAEFDGLAQVELVRQVLHQVAADAVANLFDRGSRAPGGTTDGAAARRRVRPGPGVTLLGCAVTRCDSRQLRTPPKGKVRRERGSERAILPQAVNFNNVQVGLHQLLQGHNPLGPRPALRPVHHRQAGVLQQRLHQQRKVRVKVPQGLVRHVKLHKVLVLLQRRL